ncbi:hypothetical protein [Pasteuria penetrans]|nr:hypothetical protein [Pasteuria penetrans]
MGRRRDILATMTGPDFRCGSCFLLLLSGSFYHPFIPLISIVDL